MVDNWLMEDVICNYDRKGISESFNRINSLKPLDSEIEKVIDEITQEFGSCFLTVSRPVLVDYIRDNTPKDMTYIIMVI